MCVVGLLIFVYADCLLLLVLQQIGCLCDSGGNNCKLLNLLQSFMFSYFSIYYYFGALELEWL